LLSYPLGNKLSDTVLYIVIENQHHPNPKGRLIFNNFPLGVKGGKLLKIFVKDFYTAS